MLGAGINDHIRTHRQRLLQNGGGENVIDHHARPRLMGDLGNGGDVDGVQHRIRRRFHKDALGAGGYGLAPSIQIAAIHQGGFHAKARQDVGENLKAGAEQRAGGNDVIARLHLAGQRAPNGGHAGCRAIAGFRAFQQAQAFFEHGDGGVAIAGIDIAVILAREAAFGRFGVWVDEARIEIHGFGGFAMMGTLGAAAD